MRICDFSSFLLCYITRFCNLKLVSPVYWDKHFLFGHHVAWYTTLCKCSKGVLSFTGNFVDSRLAICTILTLPLLLVPILLVATFSSPKEHIQNFLCIG